MNSNHNDHHNITSSVRESYNAWAEKYDTCTNLTRDLEKKALIENLSFINFQTCLEAGCGTGKNTEFLATQANELLSIDISEEMLRLAMAKLPYRHITFRQADINLPWTITENYFDLVVFSLILEHIENLEHIFGQAAKTLKMGGYLYLGELHPFKQYSGSKARFETETGTHVVTCFNHHVSDFILAAQKHGFSFFCLNEYFDNDDRANIPRLLTIMFRKSDSI
jgi:ubiquinone/menaquinone biosynthesis C-methylase UbiE